MANAVNLPGERLAGMLQDLLAKLRAGNITLDQLDAFLQHRNPFESVIAGLPLPEGTVIRRVKVDRNRTPQEVVDATGRTRYLNLNEDVLATMPLGEGDEVDVYFVPTNRFVSVQEVPAFLARYGLVPDPRAQAAVNEADPACADERPNGSQWGKNCYLAFYRWDGGRDVRCDRGDDDWGGSWFLSGVPAPRK